MNESQQHYERVYTLYIAAFAIDDAPQRAAYLKHECAGDEALRFEVESLLRHNSDEPVTRAFADTEIDRQRAVLEQHIHRAQHTPGDPPINIEDIQERIGAYRIIREIGRGGMGAVYEAEQDTPRRTVALKIISPGLVSPQLLRRFQYETEVLGRLQHPGIAQIYDAGTFDTGAGAQPYFAMEFIHGQPLTDYCEAHHLGTRDRLQLIIKICDAVHHAHQRGVIHRDLKPGNILVDEQGQPRILDFGIARTTDSDIQLTTLNTNIGQLIGTVPYMSPEQAAGDPNDLDTRSDVYALGVIAYELLVGRLPYNIREKMIHEAVRIIREDDPTPLSSINRNLRGDIETIIGKALAKEKDRRYQSATDLAADIRHYLHDEPISARPPSTWYNFQKFARRNKALVGGVIATILTLIIGLVGTIGYAKLEANQRQRAEQNEKDAKANLVLAEKAQAETAAALDELEDVVAFQNTQLSDLDPKQIGERIRLAMRALAATTHRRTGADESEIDAALKQFDAALEDVEFTSLAITVLQENIFDKSRAAIRRQFADRPLVRARLLRSLANSMYKVGLNKPVLEDLEEAYTIQRELLGSDALTTMNTLQGLPHALLDLRLYEQYEARLRELIASMKRVYGEAHDRTQFQTFTLAIFLLNQNRLDEAEDVYDEQLTALRQAYGDDHPSTMTMLGNLYSVYVRQGKLEKAEATLRQSLAYQRREFGEEDPRTLTSKFNLATLLNNQSKTTEAASILERVLDAQRRAESNDRLGTIQRLSSMYIKLDRLEEAESLSREALQFVEGEYGRQHSRTTGALMDLANVLLVQKRYDEAQAMFHEAWQTSVNSLGLDHHTTLHRLGWYSWALSEMKKFPEAEQRTLELEQRRRRVLGETHKNYLHTVQNLIKLYTAWHEVEPGQGYDIKAEQWRAKLPDVEPAKPVENTEEKKQPAAD